MKYIIKKAEIHNSQNKRLVNSVDLGGINFAFTTSPDSKKDLYHLT